LSLKELLTFQSTLNLLEFNLAQTSFLFVPLLQKFDFQFGLMRKRIDRSDLLLRDLFGALLIEVCQLDLVAKLLDLVVLVDELLGLALSGLFL